MKFKEWFELQETGTTTSCIAGFRRITLPLVKRVWPGEVATMFDENPPKKKKVRQPQVEEANHGDF